MGLLLADLLVAELRIARRFAVNLIGGRNREEKPQAATQGAGWEPNDLAERQGGLVWRPLFQDSAPVAL